MIRSATGTALTASIVLNLLLAGMIGGMILHKPHHGLWRSATQEMSPETRHLMARAFQKSRHDMGAEIAKIQESKQELREILSAGEFDVDAYDKELAKLYAAQAVMRARRAEAIKELAGQLPQDERKILAEGFSRPFSLIGGQDSIGPHRDENYAAQESKRIRYQPFRKDVVKENKRPEEYTEQTSASGEILPLLGPPERKPVYGPEQKIPEKEEVNSEQGVFGFESLKLEPPRDPANH